MKNNKSNNNQKVVKKSNPPQQKQQQQPKQKVQQNKPQQKQPQKPNQTKPQQQQPQQTKSKKEQIPPKKALKPVEKVEEEIEDVEENEDTETNNPLGIDSELYEDITKIQLEIDNISNKEMQQKLKLDIERDRAFTPFFNEREKLLSSIPNFWHKVITSHPILTALITGKDDELIKNLTNFKVDVMDSGNVRFNFTFKNNNFIKNKSIWKEYAFDDQGISTTCSPIQWKNGNDITKKREGEDPSFFSWFADQDDLEIFDILKHEIWMFPNDFYNN
ncbi:hypothetical protein DICPUDRAFT_84540 [Dictyostelium purpureum]|uniref:Nucleosome assembly protein n=1 Tax=Dictyostelium purpureum TaxID=5786 RepID=F1A2Y9_DICPU|nr:uncharacterized protein DICPUDRAFT_84540 [Dictyostelium purpureum]EGC29440.1 hypothetical protein DICPUDRAFT_84540 [Dictyostelium purpureum]|eukprot:XP_003294033.1 hypothetical protein DICPUDRAFT_84540 [Dictyostelium purpureum]